MNAAAAQWIESLPHRGDRELPCSNIQHDNHLPICARCHTKNHVMAENNGGWRVIIFTCISCRDTWFATYEFIEDYWETVKLALTKGE